MKNKACRISAVFFSILLMLFLLLTGCGASTQDHQTQASSSNTGTVTAEAQSKTETQSKTIDRSGSYTSKKDVSLYIHTYGILPCNYITKNEARKLGWDGGSLEPYASGKSIGGDIFSNYEGTLPKKRGRVYRECDIDALGRSSRGARRIVYSNDGLIYYTHDHYETFELLYGEAE